MAQPITPSQAISDRSYPGLSIAESNEQLRRYVHIERACMRAALAWMLEAPRYEDKYRFGYHLWDHAEHTQWLNLRLVELRGGHIHANVDPRLKIVLDEVIHAQNVAELISGLYLGLKESLLQAYRAHLNFADPSANAAEIRIIRRIIPDLERQIAWAEEVMKRPDLDSASANAWGAYINGLLAEAGGIHGLAPIPEAVQAPRPHRYYLVRPAQIKFDERIQPGTLASYSDRSNMPHEEAVLAQFKVFFNEWWAAGLLATVLLDAWEANCPWDFYYELAHHCWDEVRHSEFGTIRLKEMGKEPDQINLVLFAQVVDLPFLHRLVYLTLDMEAYFMARKRPRVLSYQAERDDRSMIFADADWSDEINHVRYGKRWTDYFLENDFRTVEDIKAEVAAHIERYTQHAHAGEKSPF